MGDRYSKIYIGGAWVDSEGSETISVVNPATEEVIAEVPAGTPGDADRAVAAARAAFETWGATPPAERGKYLGRIADILSARADELAETISAEVGMPIKIAKMAQVAGPLAHLASHGDLAEEFTWEEQSGGALVVRAPVGVVAAITPWNFPLNQVVNKIAPAILAGCTVILKPSEVAPLTAWAIAEAAEEVGLPPGVFNLVSGFGPVAEKPWSGTPTSTWSRSPVRPGPASRSPPSRRSRSSGWRSRWAASPPTSSWRTPTSTRLSLPGSGPAT
jgi:YVTN family beta-propeller protein